MLVFIDESGDPGFKLLKGSTRHFVVAMIIFADTTSAERTGKCIQAAQDRLRVKPEFKFTKCSDHIRDEFFDAIRDCEFQVHALVVEKARLYSEVLRANKEKFYSFFVQSLMRYDGGALKGAKIKIDGSGDREFKRELVGYLRRSLSKGKIADVRFVDSRSNTLIQLADMVSGAIARSYREDRQSPGRWRAKLRGKLANVWDFQ